MSFQIQIVHFRGNPMQQNKPLPPGQREIPTFPRVGLPKYAQRVPDVSVEFKLTISEDTGKSTQLDRHTLQHLQRVEQTSDFHCVTTWSRRGLHWSGFRFRDFYEQIFVPAIQPDPAARALHFRGL